LAESALPTGASRIVVTTPLVAGAHVEAALEPFCQALLCEPAAVNPPTVRITGFARDVPDAKALAAALADAAALAGILPPTPEIEPEPECDWLARNRETFRPFRVGRFFVSQEADPEVAPAGAVHLRINAGLAFGSGRHASTAGCLLALSDPLLTQTVLRPRAWRREAAREPAGPSSNFARPILDLGCGSGILAIAAAKLWHHPVLAVDVDPAAVCVAADNARRNSVNPLVHVVAANSTHHPTIRRLRPFPLVMANILARPLWKMARWIGLASRTGTVLVLAGFIEDDACGVEAVYAGHGFRRLKALTVDGWTTLVLVRRSSQSRPLSMVS
jgi:ribosomal protein L11 methyltransferase